MVVPMAMDRKVGTTPMTREMRVPNRIRVSRSRPIWSVPSQWRRLGAWVMRSRSMAEGS